MSTPVTDEREAGYVRTVDSAVGHLVGSTTIYHCFWTTSFFSDTLKILPRQCFVNSFLGVHQIVLLKTPGTLLIV
jgi:hypothetical protein